MLSLFKQAGLIASAMAISTSALVVPRANSAAASGAASALMNMYNATDGLWGPTSLPWWISGNALQAVLDYMEYSGTRNYISQAQNTISIQRAPVSWWPQGGGDFRADSTDDTAWWALANLRLYDLTGTAQYLNIAKEDEAYIYSYRDNGTCGRGILWNIPSLSYVNAISNELYLLLAASLHNRIPGDTTYLAHAQAEWKFFEHSGIINSQHLINDGLSESSSSCTNNGQTTWTYNQGVILGGLVELYKATGNATLLTVARQIADATTSTSGLSPNGILRETCEPAGNCDIDQRLFKGVFTRYLGALNRQLSGAPYTSWLTNQINSVTAHDQNGNLYGLNWAGPYATADVPTQLSALSLFTSVL